MRASAAAAPLPVPVGPRLDPWLAAAALLLVGLGLLMVLSAGEYLANKEFRNPLHFFQRQLLSLGMGVGAATAVLLPGGWWRRLAMPFYGVSLALVWAVQVGGLGHTAKGAARWIDLGPVNLQPSELGKLGVAFALSHYFANHAGRLRDVVGVVLPGLLLFYAPMVLGIVLQRDLGTILLMSGVAFVALVLAGLELRWLALGGAVAAAGAVLLVLAEPYRVSRVLHFLDPLTYHDTEGYQVSQGWVAIAMGGPGGVGYGRGAAQQGFLPEAHTDMISAVLFEELGLPGWLLMFALYAVVLGRGVQIALASRSVYDMLLAGTLTALLGAQVVINTGVVVGLLPPKGLVLPFLSYGASALLAHLIIVAVLLRVDRHNRMPAAARPQTDPGAGLVAPPPGRR